MNAKIKVKTGAVCDANMRPTSFARKMGVGAAVSNGVLAPALEISFPCVMLSYYSDQRDQYTTVAICTDPAYWCVVVEPTPRAARESLSLKLRKLLVWLSAPEQTGVEWLRMRYPSNTDYLEGMPERWSRVLTANKSTAPDWARLLRYLNRWSVKFRIKNTGHDFSAFDLPFMFGTRLMPKNEVKVETPPKLAVTHPTTMPTPNRAAMSTVTPPATQLTSDQ